MTTIRPATTADIPAITTIFNRYIVDSHVSFDLEPWTVDERLAWFAKYGGDSPRRVWVAADDEAGTVLGATWSSQFRPKPAYSCSVETTIVLDDGAIGRGLGTRLYSALLADIDARDVHRAYAVIALPNDASVALHHRLGFETLSEQHEVGFKLGRYWSTVLMERRHPAH